MNATAKSSEPRLSLPGLKVLARLLTAPDGLAGADLTRGTGVIPGTMYPLLARLERHGWLSGTWEAEDPARMGRPRRRTYVLTDLGRTAVADRLRELGLPSRGAER